MSEAPGGPQPHQQRQRRRLPRRPLPRLSLPTALVLGVAAVALLLRWWDLGERAMHHDESLHATFAWYYAQGRGYVHDPLMHGPLQFHLLAGLFRLFGDGEVTARLPMALAGTALVVTPLLWRRSLGTLATIAAATLIAFSPVLLYYSRFARNDPLSALWTALLFGGAWRYRTDGQARWLVLVAAALGLGLATKETTYLSAAVLLLWINAGLVVAHPRWLRGGWRQRIGIAPVAWALALWAVLRPARRSATDQVTDPATARLTDLLVVMGTLITPTLGALIQIPLGLAGVEARGTDERSLAIAVTAALGLGVAVVGVRWRPWLWPLLALTMYAIAVPLYASMFTHTDGVGGLFWTSLDYWLDQQDVQRGNQPWFYYLMMLPLYEMLSLALIAAASPWLLQRGEAIDRFLGWWVLGTLIALSAAGEKMPWLTVHLALPLALLGGRGCALLLAEGLRRAPALRPLGGAVAGVMVVSVLLLAALSGRSAVRAAFVHSDLAVEPLMYTQTSPDVPELAALIGEYTAARGGLDHPIVVDSALAVHWPWAWYLRDYRAVAYLGPYELNLQTVDRAAIVIAAPISLEPFAAEAGAYPERRDYRHRVWFPEGGYRDFGLGDLLDAGTGGRVVSFLTDRLDEQEIGVQPAVVLFPEPLSGTGAHR